MTVSVLLFASYADLLGGSRVELELDGNATIDDVLAALARMPNGNRLPARPLVAVNEVYAVSGQALAPGDEVAVIPPVAGG
jgi:molybdopterin converting factor small subunit